MPFRKTAIPTTTRPDLSLEDRSPSPVCGLDEAGRAPLAGPVFAACVHIFPENRDLPFWAEVNDSKKVSAPKRELLSGLIREHAAFGVAQASPDEIDTLNIHHASLLAMKRAFFAMLDAFSLKPATALVDGKFAPALPCSAQTVIGGDGISLSIAAASILAKTARDHLMRGLHEEHPHYGWNRNAGYPTPEHLAALHVHGITKYHRLSFAPCKKLLASQFEARSPVSVILGKRAARAQTGDPA